jgi:hypothetical protein
MFYGNYAFEIPINEMNVPEADMSLVSRSNALFPPVVIGSSLTGSGRINLSY